MAMFVHSTLLILAAVEVRTVSFAATIITTMAVIIAVIIIMVMMGIRLLPIMIMPPPTG